MNHMILIPSVMAVSLSAVRISPASSVVFRRPLIATFTLNFAILGCCDQKEMLPMNAGCVDYAF